MAEIDFDLRAMQFTASGWSISWSEEDSDFLQAVIHAENITHAQGCANLIYAGLALSAASLPQEHDYLFAIPKGIATETPPNWSFPLTNNALLSMRAAEACDIATRSSDSDRYRHALQKYLLGLRLTSWFPENLGEYALTLPDHYVSYAYAIILAYSAIEELGLEVRVPKGGTSRDNQGNWVPEIFNELAGRLVSANVDLRELVPWYGGSTNSTNIEDRRRTIAPDRTPAKLRKLMAFEQIDICDAIGHLGWLRSCISSHRFSERTKDLAHFDVVNSQNVARRLLLDSIGLPLSPSRRKYIYSLS